LYDDISFTGTMIVNKQETISCQSKLKSLSRSSYNKEILTKFESTDKWPFITDL